MTLDALHIIGYLGAAGSLIFGGNQLRIIVAKGQARDVSIFDYVVRVVYATLLGIYSIGTHDRLFMVVNFGAALLSAGVVTAAVVENRKHS